MLRGPKPKPTSVKKQKGTAKKSRLLSDEYAPPAISSLPPPPDYFNQYAIDEYLTVGEKLFADKLISEIDISSFIMYCAEMGNYKYAQAVLQKEGRVFKIKKSGYMGPHPMVAISNTSFKNAMAMGSQFGITPSARTRVAGPKKVKDNPIAHLIVQNGKSKTA